MRYLLAIIAVLGLSPVVCGSARAATISNCQPNIVGMPSAGVRCEVTGVAPAPARGPAPVYRWQDVRPTPCSTIERMGVDAASLCEARAVATVRKKIGDLIGDGKCDEALKAALGTGDVGYAKEVRDFCTTSPAPAAPAP